MTVGPALRRVALTAHVATSVAWLGSVAVVLVLAIIGISSEEDRKVRAVYLTIQLVGTFVLVPLALASLLTGIVQSLVTKWGLIRHYWVVVKLVITLVATIVLLTYTETLGAFADIAAAAPAPSDAEALRAPSVVLHAGVGLLLLLCATALAVFKPAGVTRYGWRRQRREG